MKRVTNGTFIHDFILKKVFPSVLQDVSKKPNISIFSFFQTNLSNIQQNQYTTRIGDEEMAKKIIKCKYEIITFVERAIQPKLPKEYYKKKKL